MTNKTNTWLSLALREVIGFYGTWIAAASFGVAAAAMFDLLSPAAEFVALLVTVFAAMIVLVVLIEKRVAQIAARHNPCEPQEEDSHEPPE